MQMTVPFAGDVDAADARLMRLAEFLGIDCCKLPLDSQTRQPADLIDQTAADRRGCFVMNPRVIRRWVADARLGDLARCLLSRFRFILAHALTADPFCDALVSSLTSGWLKSVKPVADSGQQYEIRSTAAHVCGPFAGLSFGPVNPANDCVFALGGHEPAARNLISIGGLPLMAAVRSGAAEVVCIAGGDVADMDAHAGYSPLDSHFSRFMPHAMALRHIFGEQCWHPGEAHASIIVDDPLLRPRYGFLKFEDLLSLMREHKFHTSVAFIPHNYQRNSERVLRLFRDNPRCFSICFHGNDHTRSEFASRDIRFLSSAVSAAEKRMELLHQRSQLRCDKALVFPQSDFSLEAMQVLGSRNFLGGVSSAWHPRGQPTLPTLRDICQPAILRFGGFPLFGRNCARDTRSQDVAFNVFFGKPTLTGEHHDTFEHPQQLVEAAQRINSLAARISWSNLETALSGSYLRRRGQDGGLQIRPSTRTVNAANSSGACERLSIVWSWPGEPPQVEKVLRGGLPFVGAEVGDHNVRVDVELAPGRAETFSLICRSSYPVAGNPGWLWAARVFVRRRLSEARDNYLSRNRQLGRLAKAAQRRLSA